MSSPPPRARDLPDDLALPLTDGAEWWYWLGGRPSLDLVNTLRERWRRRVETLCSAGDLTAWLAAAGLLDPRAESATGADLEDARVLREAIDSGLTAVTEGVEPPPDAVAVIDGWLAAGAGRPALTIAQGRVVLREAGGDATPVRRALAAVALDAARMLGTPERTRVRICASPTCSARFFDRSPAGRRRWCAMSGCGNRAKVRRHRARGGPSGPTTTTRE